MDDQYYNWLKPPSKNQASVFIRAYYRWMLKQGFPNSAKG